MARKKAKSTMEVVTKAQATCFLKRSYTHRKHAIAGVKSHWNNKGIVVYYYKCPICGLFHITKKEQRKPNASNGA